jgi:hypothetical protein
MNSQYMYLFLLCDKFKLVYFDKEKRHLDRFPVISHTVSFTSKIGNLGINLFAIKKKRCNEMEEMWGLISSPGFEIM